MKKLFLAVALVAASLSATAQISEGFANWVTYAVSAGDTLSKASAFPTAPNVPGTYTSANGTTFYMNGIRIDAATGISTYTNNTSGFATTGRIQINKWANDVNGCFLQLPAFSSLTSIKMAVMSGSTTAGKETSLYLQQKISGTWTTIDTVLTKIKIIDLWDPSSKVDASQSSIILRLRAGLLVPSTPTIFQLTTVGTLASDNGFAGVKEAISSDLLKKAGDALVNPTALSVEVYSVTGVKVLTSAKTSINVSELPQGVYVAKTAKGTLKFIK